MVWRLVHLSILASMMILSACADRDGEAGCLGGPGSCEGIYIESQSSSVNEESAELSCSAIAYPSQVGVNESVRVQIDTYGGEGTKKIFFASGDTVSFASSTSLEGTYGSDKAGTVVRKTVKVVDAEGDVASCDFSVEVLDGTSSDGFACRIDVAPDLINPGQQANFSFTAVNAPSSVTYSNFQPNSNWVVPNAGIIKTSNTTAKATVQYDFKGTKQASIEAVSAGRRVICRKSFKVGTPNSSTTTTTLTGCNVETAPLGYAGDGSQASLAGTVTRLRAIPKGGTAPFTVSVSSIANHNGYQLLGSSAGPAAAPQLLAKFFGSGAPLVKLSLKDSTNKTVTCQTYHISNPNNVIAVAPNVASSGTLGPKVKVFKLNGSTLLDEFPAFESTYAGQVKLATADFDGDGITDIVAASNAASANRIKIFKGSNTVTYTGKPAPLAIAEVLGGLNNGVEINIGAGDINRDGLADIILADGCGATSPKIRVLSGQADRNELANFQVPPFGGVATGVADVAAADYNMDGYLDIAVSSCTGGRTYVFSGKDLHLNYLESEITEIPEILKSEWLSNTTNPLAIAAGDSDADGEAQTFFNDFGASLAAADLNGDGYADAIQGYQASSGSVARIRAYSGQSGGLMTEFIPFSGFIGALSVAAGN